jgi:hypothetical protein
MIVFERPKIEVRIYLNIKYDIKLHYDGLMSFISVSS